MSKALYHRLHSPSSHNTTFYLYRLLSWVHPQIQLPIFGNLRTAMLMSEEAANDTAAVANIATGVGIKGRNCSNTGKSTNMCSRYVP